MSHFSPIYSAKKKKGGIHNFTWSLIICNVWRDTNQVEAHKNTSIDASSVHSVTACFIKSSD